MRKGHFNYGIILIQKSADVKVPIYNEFPNRIAKMWRDEEKEARRKQGEDVEMEGSDDDKKHRNIFKTDPYNMRNIMFGAGSDSEDSNDEEDSDESSDHGSDMEFNVMTS